MKERVPTRLELKSNLILAQYRQLLNTSELRRVALGKMENIVK